MEAHRGQFSLTTMGRLLEASLSGFYRWSGKGDTERDRSNRSLLVEIKAVYKECHGRYGSPRVHRKLRRNGVPCSENRVARIMRREGIQAIQARKFRVTTDSEHDLPVAENLLDRQFDVATPNATWTADMTYVWTKEGWLYLAVIMDLCSRRILGSSMRSTLHRSMVLDALRQALRLRRPAHGLLHHSDRGSQYASNEYREALTKAGVSCSMSRKGDCWDNAPTESFFATLKREMVFHRRFETRAEARSAIFEFIEVWYNRQRLHSSLGYLTPVEFENQYYQSITALAA